MFMNVAGATNSESAPDLQVFHSIITTSVDGQRGHGHRAMAMGQIGFWMVYQCTTIPDPRDR